MTTPVPMVTVGRSAWTLIGKDNGSVRYAYFVDRPKDGFNPFKNVNYLAVHLGIKAIQTRTNQLLPNANPLAVDGHFGPATSTRVKMAQKALGLLEDGQVGSLTARAFWKGSITYYANWYKFEPKYLWGQVALESSFDVGAVGWSTPGDRGLSQINLPSHPEISASQAHDPDFCLPYSAKRFADALYKYRSNPSRQVNAAILQHNNPVSANKYFNTGVYSSQKSADYVAAVLRNAQSY
jgi:peptidoglycan hydrolase-like protein with peptidoglycan-binding domain